MKSFVTYYYNIHKLWEISKNNLIGSLNSKVWNREWYEIRKIPDNYFFIHLVQKHQFDLLPKMGTVVPITYRDNKKYIDAINSINWFSFGIASVDTQRPFWVGEDSDIWDVYKIKEKLWGDTLSFYIWSKEWLSKSKVKAFIQTHKHMFSKSPKITVDQFWKKIQQEVDKIRFKSTIQIELEWRELDFDIVMFKMEEDFNSEISKIKLEYNYSS